MNEDGAPLVSHLLELRRRLTYAALSVLVTTAVAFVFHEQVLVLLMEPAQQFVDIPGGKPIYTELTEFISVAAKTSLLVGLFVSLPLVLYQVVMFVAPGLKPKGAKVSVCADARELAGVSWLARPSDTGCSFHLW